MYFLLTIGQILYCLLTEVANIVIAYWQKWPTLLLPTDRSCQHCYCPLTEVANIVIAYWQKLPTLLLSTDRSGQHCYCLLTEVANIVIAYWQKWPTLLLPTDRSGQHCYCLLREKEFRGTTLIFSLGGFLAMYTKIGRYVVYVGIIRQVTFSMLHVSICQLLMWHTDNTHIWQIWHSL